MQGSAPLDYFLHAYGPAARPTIILGWVFTAIAGAVCIVIAVLLIAAILRRRPPRDVHDIGREGEGVHWITVGTGVTVCALLGMAVYMFVALNAVSMPPAEPALTIKVTAYDWWWKAEYDGFETANEIHIPIGVPVLIKLESADVIHAFWVPQLTGKTETIPGLTNQQWLQADVSGVYRGQCTQFCGAQHAHMAFEVVAQSSGDFHAWEEAQRHPAIAAPPPVFIQQCAACHAVRGTGAAGGHAPDLTHVMSRRLIAAGMLTNTPEHMMEWVQHAQEIKPGCRMPDIALSAQEASALSAYLSALK